jgi:hypothetical protein
MTNPPFRTAGTSQLLDLQDSSWGFLGGMSIDADGSGGNPEQDPDFQDTTTYRNSDGTSLNLRVDRIFVIPEDWVRDIPGIVMGCQGEITDLLGGVTTPVVPAECGPNDKAGEASVATAEYFGVDSNPLTGGTTVPRFFYRFWPGKPGYAGGKTYELRSLLSLR